MALPVDFVNTNSQELVDGRVNEGFFPFNVFLSQIVGRSLTEDGGRPGVRDMLGSLRPSSSAEKRAILGSNKAQVSFMTKEMGGGAGVLYRGVAPQIAELDITGAVEIPWTVHIQPVKVMKDDVDKAQGSFQIIDVQARAINQAMKEADKLIGVSLISGNPASQTAIQLEEYISIIATLDVDLNAAWAGSGNRITTDTFLLPALYHDSATLNFDWSLIDDMNRGGGGDNNNPNGGAATLGTGVDLVLCNESLFYQTILPKARADGYQIITKGKMHEAGLVGFMRPVVDYMGAMITFDPNFPTLAKNGTAKSYLAGLTMESWEYQLHPSHDFRITPWVDVQATTRERAFVADIEITGRLICNEPWKNALFANVS